MSKTIAKQTQVNEGIIATTVNSDVLAVGQKAKATKNIGNDRERLQILELTTTIEDVLRKSRLDSGQLDILQQDVDFIKEILVDQAEPEEAASALNRFMDKLKMVQGALGDSKKIFESIKSIVSLLKIPAKLLMF